MINPQQWTSQIGSAADDIAESIVFDGGSNRLYLTGFTAGGIDVETANDGTVENDNAGVTDDVWLAQYSQRGELLWFRQFGTPLRDRAHGVSNNNNGEILITGETFGDIDPDFAIDNQGFSDPFIAKYDESGNRVWITQFGSSGRDFAQEIVTDDAGNSYIAGFTDGNLGGANQGQKDVWLAKFDDNGNQVWLRQFGTVEIEETESIALDSNGNLYLTGSTRGGLEGTNAGETDAWVASYDSNGNQRWIQQFGTPNPDISYDIAVDTNNDVYLTGSTRGTLEGSNQLSADAWLAKFNSTGQQQWVRQLGDVLNNDYGFAVTADRGNNIYITGDTLGNLSPDPEEANQGSRDIFIAQYDPEGNLLDIAQFGTSANDSVNDITADDQENVYIAANTEGAFGEDSSNQGGFDLIGSQIGAGDIDRNNSPRVENATFTLIADSQDDTVVGTVIFSDPNEDQVTLEIISGNPDTDGDGKNVFNIDPITGQIIVADADELDIERNPTFNLQVRGTDPEGEFDIGSVTVNLIEKLQQFILINNEELPADRSPISTVNLSDDGEEIFQDSSFSFDVFYDATEDNLAGLGLRLHYDSSQVNFQSFDQLLSNGFFQQSSQPQDYTADFDDDETTDKFINVVWTAAVGGNNWPGNGGTPALLYSANFTTEPDLFASESNVTTAINFTASSQPTDFELVSQSAEIDFTQYTYDIDGDGEINALTDGRLILRFLFGLNGDDLVAGAVAQEATRKTPEAIEKYLKAGINAFDVDGNGEADPLTDGIIINRLILGFEGEDVIEGAVTADAQRSTTEDILSWINERSYNSPPEEEEETPPPEEEEETPPPEEEEETPPLETNINIPDQEFTIDENQETGASVGNFVIENPNGELFELSITSGNPDNDRDGLDAFSVNQSNQSGEIIINDGDEIDFEQEDQFRLRVSAVSELGRDTGLITININDIEETVSIPEQTIAVDENSVITGNTVGFFTINIKNLDPTAVNLLISDGNEDNDRDGLNAFSILLDSQNSVGILIANDADELELQDEFRLEIEAVNQNTEESLTTGEITVQINQNEEETASVFPHSPPHSETNQEFPDLSPSLQIGNSFSSTEESILSQTSFPLDSIETLPENIGDI